MDKKKFGLIVICSILVVMSSGCIAPGGDNYTQGFSDGAKSITQACSNGSEPVCVAFSAVKGGECVLVITNSSECKLSD